ncbi:MAG: hypothetical protein COB15_03960 [Flavobacteriales bacterium]|nr:MAG: hypothetical protein COB15_03960 [Flavobacteriales bacterium]
MKNKIKDSLLDLKIIDKESIINYYPKVRDRDDVSVLKCEKSGVIFLSSTDHIDSNTYENNDGFSYWGAGGRAAAINANSEDANRRTKEFGKLITNKKWVDIGTGAGGILDAMSSTATETWAVEPQESARRELNKMGYNVLPSIAELPNDYFEIVTLFHVLEHFTTPLDTLKEIYSKMKKGGKIIVEIPHARDFLISFLNLESFKASTFWSEHIILHTRSSITRFLEESGFENIVISGLQRYPLANHLHWLSKDKPGGHAAWPFLGTEQLDTEYSNMLSNLDMTDTLIIIAEK